MLRSMPMPHREHCLNTDETTEHCLSTETIGIERDRESDMPFFGSNTSATSAGNMSRDEAIDELLVLCAE